jgi:hypothetical protein
MQEGTKEILSINKRIVEVLEFYGATRYKASHDTGISEQVLLNIYKGNNKPSLETIERIVKVHKVNANWLISGDGDMLNEPKAE